MARADVTIYGAGIFGLSIAFACLQRGARVQVIDPHGVGAGASGGIVGALAPHVPENWNAKKAFQFESLLMAEEFWQKIHAISGLHSGYTRAGRLLNIEDDASLCLAKQRAQNAQNLWQGRADWRIIESKANPWGVAPATGYMIHETLSAHLHPRRAVEALAKAIQTLGGRIIGDGEAMGKVLYATGVADLTAITAAQGRNFGNGVKGQAALFDCALPNVPQGFFDALHFVPHLDGGVAVGSTSERDFTDPLQTDDQLEVLITRARKIVPALAEAPIQKRWAGVRPRSKSRAPVLGAHPLYKGAFIANGGFKIGFGMAPKIGEVMANLVMNGHDTIPEAFRAETLRP